MIYDIKKYIKKWAICQSIHKSILHKPLSKQIVSQNPKERYLLDLTYINDEIKDTKYNFEYILNIVDHYSKL